VILNIVIVNKLLAVSFIRILNDKLKIIELECICAR
jgi:hypothetical protein